MAIGQRSNVCVDVALVQKHTEDVLYDLSMVVRSGGREQVEGYAQALPRFEELLVIAGHHLLGRDAVLLRSEGDGRAVLVAAGYHEHVVTLQPVVAGKDVRGQIAPGDVPHVKGAVSVGPSHSYENAFGHRLSIVLDVLVHCSTMRRSFAPIKCLC